MFMLNWFPEKWQENYTMKPSYFWGWILLLVILGMLGFWVPLVYSSLNDKEISLGKTIINGSLSTFSIVILVESLLTGLSLPKNEKASYLLLSIACILILFHSLIYAFIISGTESYKIKWVVLIATLISIIVTILFYQYKNLDLVEGADAYVNKQNDEVENAIQVSSENPLP